jgi:hypothetical protein
MEDHPLTVTQDQLEKLVRFLKRELGLERWDIRCAVVRPVTLEGAMGDCEFDADSRVAFLRLRDVQDSEQAWVDTVVHELVHCVLWWADYNTEDSNEKLWSKVLEQSMRDLTKPIVKWVLSRLPEILK